MNLKPFQKGQSGNPNGRPKGSKHKLGEDFLSALYADWQEHGAATIAKVRDEKPDQYLKVVASLVPKEVNVSTSALDDLTDDELAEAIRVLDESIKASRGEAPADEAPTTH